MKIILAILLSVMVVGCGTLGGAVSGAGDDLKKVGNWIKPSK
jgi:predicted small secreted protein